MIGIAAGLYFLIWSTITQWKIGNGTPAPNAPTQHLIIIGPYKYCRNPIEFGAILYYLGLGILVGGIIIGIINCILGFIVGSIYHKFIEEKELEERFGEEYIKYKENTPFVIPKIKIGKNK
jgi:protein-S-isoprenylcysteine O-methyltransferase Ste14